MSNVLQHLGFVQMRPTVSRQPRAVLPCRRCDPCRSLEIKLAWFAAAEATQRGAGPDRRKQIDSLFHSVLFTLDTVFISHSLFLAVAVPARAFDIKVLYHLRVVYALIQ